MKVTWRGSVNRITPVEVQLFATICPVALSAKFLPFLIGTQLRARYGAQKERQSNWAL